MTKKQAYNLMEDLRKNLRAQDYCEDIYLRLKDEGEKIFKNCAYFESENWIFVWTLDNSFLFNYDDIGDLVLNPAKETKETLCC
jgi:hypothetical protein